MRPEELELRTRLQPLRPPQAGPGSRTQGATSAEKKSAFSKVLAGELASRGQAAGISTPTTGVEFSAHALTRLQERNVMLSPHNLQRLDQGVRLAERKGSVNTLVLMDDTAFIVSVKNKKVITAITKDAAVANVFTQIDSATIV
ncbi:MAG: TIGR02530 family flagellar biosynthesis protein [Candidatus Neomarinimicrobiota bacterium]